MYYEQLVARELKLTPGDLLRETFKGKIGDNEIVDALFIDSSFKRVIGVSNLKKQAPVVMELLKNNSIANFLLDAAKPDESLLILLDNDNKLNVLSSGKDTNINLPSEIAEYITNLIKSSYEWAGVLNENGEHIIDLRTPTPGPHFYVNLLMGNRVGYSHALQTTPKSVIDRMGRGSFRSHAASQVLATRWDLRQEENGFPANRQFYLLESNKKIFYSADPLDSNIESAVCTHSQNHTKIKYVTKCGLEIERVIFILPQMEGLPLATEVQQIKIKNTCDKSRNLKIVYTGMFGSAAAPAVFEDVLYSNIIMQAKVLKDSNGAIVAIGPDYYPEPWKEDLRFNTMIIHKNDEVEFPKEFCMNYNEFVGNGTLENPQGLSLLSNNLYRKGPGFFAVAGEIEVLSNSETIIDNFTGIISKKVNPDFNENTFENEIKNLITRFSKAGEAEKALGMVSEFYDRYSSFLKIQSGDEMFDTYVNKNLPFQVLYQTFVSRSFCQTQKGYREMGFREIQDIYASMYYFVNMGMNDFIKQLLKEWCTKVFEFGFAYHNFFWVGKEPGKWSDDALWFIQAVHRYISLTGDIGFLDEECEIAGTDPVKCRPVYETIKAILLYSGEISIGKHGMPLLDNADWNDCLKLDNDFIDGITKEKLYKKQISNGGFYGEPLKSDYSESVMNAFLLKLAIDQMVELSGQKGDAAYKWKLEGLSQKLYVNLQKHAWKEDFYARVLFNRYSNDEYTYLGAKGDKLSADPNLDGSYFLNSFSWSVLSQSATAEQIKTMLDTIESVLKTPFGIKLCSPTDLEKVAKDTATGHYYPGDRENGGVFKHACMMSTSAMFKAAKEVEDEELALRLSRLAYWMIDLVLPYRTMNNPYSLCGNPRFCTQYNNSDTGENIGPMLSGTSTWLTLTLLDAFGIEYTQKGIKINPILREEQRNLQLELNTGKALYNISYNKPEGFYRITGDNVTIELDGKKLEGNILPVFDDNSVHQVKVVFGK